MKMFPKFKKYSQECFSKLAIVVVFLFTESSFAKSDSFERYHASLAEKYGYNASEVTVTRVTNPVCLKTMKELSEKTRLQLVDFASSIDAHAFTYKANNDYWRLNKGKRVLSHTFSIDILKNNVKLFDYYCFAMLKHREDAGFTAGCSAYDFTEK